jgi:hypothetical protein
MKIGQVEIMTRTSSGWILFIAGLGVMASLTANDIRDLEAWESATSPSFIGNMFAHFGAVITAFVGGKLLPGNGREGD